VREVLTHLAADTGGAGSVLDGRPVVIDRDYVLAAIGLLAGEHPAAAEELAAALVRGRAV
jgi:hypothetical protein